MTENLDQRYGPVRLPEKVDEWERDRKPASLSDLRAAARSLLDIENLANSFLMRQSLRAQNFLWVMDADGFVLIAVEELAITYPDVPYSGYPRRRGYRHPHEEKKLGHPTLVAGGPARIAGELALDTDGAGLRWILNANSGRYCRQMPPDSAHLACVAALFKAHGVTVNIDCD